MTKSNVRLIQIEHVWEDRYSIRRVNVEGVVETKDTDVAEKVYETWYAVDTSNWYAWEEDGDGFLGALAGPSWHVNGTTLVIHSKQDIAGLRKLLDAIEQDFNEKKEAK